MPFRVLALPGRLRDSAHPFRYHVQRAGRHLVITIPPEIAARAELKAGDTAQFQVGDKEHVGCFGIGKGKTNCRKLQSVKNGSGTGAGRLQFTLPYLVPLQKEFPRPGGGLHLVDAAKGVIVFSVVKS